MAAADGSAINRIADAYRARAITLVRFDAGLRAKVLKLLSGMDKELLSLLRQAEIGDLLRAQKQRLDGLLTEVERLVASTYAATSSALLTDLSDFARLEAKWVLKAFEQGLGTPLLTKALTQTQIATIADDTLIQGAPTAEWWKRSGQNTVQRFSDAIRQGMVAGETNAELVRRVRGTAALKFKDGVMQTTRRGAEALVRSSVQAVANEARVRFYAANDDLVKGTEYYATLDGRTTQQCAALDGYRWDLQGNPAPGQGKAITYQQPPLHLGCRSTLIPWLKSFSEIGFEGIDLPPITRASLDGPQVLDDEGFEGWLKKKPAEFQADLIGVGKAKLFREGRIGLRDLVDQSGRPLTLAEVEAAL